MNIAAFKTYTTFSIIQHALSIIFLSALTSLQFNAQHASANEQTSYEWCEDLDGKFLIHSVPLQNPKAKPCAWVGREDFVTKRCEIAEARLYCPKICNNCSCSNNKNTFTLNGQETNCARVFNNPTFWCNFPEAVSNCPLSCGACEEDKCQVTTEEPTLAPTITDTVVPSAASTLIPPTFTAFQDNNELQAAAKTWCEDPNAWVAGSILDCDKYGYVSCFYLIIFIIYIIVILILLILFLVLIQLFIFFLIDLWINGIFL